MKVVTGGAGFIGSHLARELAKQDDVVIFDNLSAGDRNLKDLPHNVKLVIGDIRDLDALKGAFKGADCIFHLAAQTSVQRSIEFPQETEEINIRGTLNVLEAARYCKAQKVIFSSSAAVYGDSPVSPKKEDMPPAPLSLYAVSKLSGEYFCRVYNDLFNVKTISLRYFNVFGPGQDPDSDYAAVIPKFIKLMSEGKQPIIFGDGNQTRDFVFVKDVVNANMMASKADINGEVVNIASGNSINLLDLVDSINSLLGKDIKPVFEAARPGDIKESVADISLAKKIIGYSPAVGFEEGLRSTL